MVHVI